MADRFLKNEDQFPISKGLSNTSSGNISNIWNTFIIGKLGYWIDQVIKNGAYRWKMKK